MAIAGRIFDRLVSHCGTETVFMDIENIPFGTNFRRHIDDALSDCDVLVAVVGPQWLGSRQKGSPRIYEKNDPVRVEIQTALRRGITIVPVLVEGAKMPTERELPRGLKQFSLLNALEVASGRDFNVHVERLVSSAKELVGSDIRIPTGEAISASQVAAERGSRAATGAVVKRDTMNALGTFFACLLVAIFLLVLSHYLIVVRFDLSPLLLRVITIVVPLSAGFVFFSQNGRGWAPALLLAVFMGLIAVLCMLTTVNLVDGAPIIPTTTVDWQEALEYFVTIALAALAGNALARLYRLSLGTARSKGA